MITDLCGSRVLLPSSPTRVHMYGTIRAVFVLPSMRGSSVRFLVETESHRFEEVNADEAEVVGQQSTFDR